MEVEIKKSSYNRRFYGKHHTEETKARIREAQKGELNSMYGRKGELSPLYGNPCSEETKAKISETHKGVSLSEEHRVRISEGRKGIHLSEETKRCLSELMAGEANPFYGKHHTEATKQRLRELCRLGVLGRKGHKNTPEHNARISASNKIAYQDPELRENLGNRVYYKTKEFREAISRAQTGRKRTAQQLKAHSKMMKAWIKKNGHPSLGMKRTPEQCERMSIAHIGIQAGGSHPRWLGGKSLEPYGLGWTVARKKLVRARDNHICQLCICQPRYLDIHHIDYDKKNNDESNWISLCHRCNGRINISRVFWGRFFQDIMAVKRYKLLSAR